MTHIIAVLNQKGGVGKTTTTINLAAYLAKAGKTVLIVDADPQGNATSGLGIDKQDVNSTLYEVLLSTNTLEQAVVTTNIKGISLLPSNSNLASIESDVAGTQGREVLLRTAISNLNYEYILVDCPPALGLLTVNSLVASDWLLIPVQAEYYAMEGLGQLIDVFQRVKTSMNQNLQLLGILVTMYNSRTSLAQQVVDELSTHFGDSVFKTVIPRNVRLAEAPSYGVPISEHDKWSKGARAYKALAKEVINRVEH